MATTARSLWKGAISFGLVHIPVSLHAATTESGIDFDWLDKRSMDPVGYKRVNKKTGKEVDKENIVKGVEYQDGRYVVLSDAEIKAAYPKATQSIDIEAFVSAAEIPFVYLDRPYYLAPLARGAKVYALLRETLRRAQRVGVARVVIQNKQHLAALLPAGPALVLHLLRWPSDIRPWKDLPLPGEGSKGLNEGELKMATQLVDDMTAPWKPDAYREAFTDEVMALVKRKAKAGKTETVAQPERAEAPGKAGNVIDLTELLQRSLGQRTARASTERPAPRARAAKPGKAKASAKSAPKARRRAA